MKFARTNLFARSVIAAMALLGWLVLSNHCALGEMVRAAQEQGTHECCHGKASSPDQVPFDRKPEPQCCWSLQVTAGDVVKFQLWPPEFFVAVIDAVVSPRLSSGAEDVAELDNGPPPRVATFSELVLHRSLRSHAPPSFG